MKQDCRKVVSEIVRKSGSSDPFYICKVLGIEVFFSALGSVKGLMTTNYGVHVIILNENLSEPEARFSCAHELGHICLKHDYNKIWMENHTGFNVNKFENEANQFAIHLLLEHLDESIWESEYQNPERICRAAGIPLEYASYFEHLNIDNGR